MTPTPAEAAGWPYGPTPHEYSPVVCNVNGPSRVNVFDLFAAMGEPWEGCVEARPSPYDVRDIPPGSNPDTQFVPYMWPDETDGWPGTSPSSLVRNDYLPRASYPSWMERHGNSQIFDQAYVWKYRSPPNSDYTSFIERGPNAACPEPIVPLTGTRAELDASIASLRSVGAAGTNSALGMMWGWRVLSPDAPFTEGIPYDPENSSKIVILMTDGINDVTPQPNSWNQSDFGAYGYIQDGRLGANRPSTQAQLDNRLRTICRSMKDDGTEIIIYTVMFDPEGGLPSSVRALFRGCASDPDLYFEASSPESLVAAFQEIANDIRRLRLAE
ncbi:MAG: hypothetical protein KDI98_07465 [Hyphomicrobiaceae bacterium]|nr:hypothetical protein [Hyphomicrobiaceae bacterium]